MTFLIAYLTIGGASFIPMLWWDKDARECVLESPLWLILAAWVIWSIVWVFSIRYDLVAMAWEKYYVAKRKP